jgi:hypothetical protein
MISKRDLIERMKAKEAAGQSTSNLSKSTLDSMARNKELVDSGQLPKYVGGTADVPSNPEVEKQAERVYEFIFGQRKSRNEY